jgi:hypothetical protein
VPEVVALPRVAEALAVPAVRRALVVPGEALAVPEALPVLEALAVPEALEASLGATVALAVLGAPVVLGVPGECAEARVGLRVAPGPGGRCCRRGRMLSVRPGSFAPRVPSPSGVRGRRPVGPGVRRRLRPLGGRGVPELGMSGGLLAVAGFGPVPGLALTAVVLSVPWMAVPTSGG